MILTHNLHMFLVIQKLKTFYKNSRLDKSAIKCGVRFYKKWLYLALDYFEQKRAKKYQKNGNCQHYLKESEAKTSNPSQSISPSSIVRFLL